jgi:hypothetical protein
MCDATPTPGSRSLLDNPIRGSAEPRVEDYQAVWGQAPAMRRAAGWLLVMVVGMPVAFSLRKGFDPLVLLAIPVLLAAGAFGIWRGRRSWSEAMFRSVGGMAIEYFFDGQGYQTRTPGREGRAEWGTLHGFAETPAAFLLYVSPHIFHLVPKRAFPEADQARLSAELRARVKPLGKGPSGLKKALVLWVVLIVAYLAIWQFLGHH